MTNNYKEPVCEAVDKHKTQELSSNPTPTGDTISWMELDSTKHRHTVERFLFYHVDLGTRCLAKELL